MDQENYTWLPVEEVAILQGGRDTKTANITKYMNNKKKAHINSIQKAHVKLKHIYKYRLFSL